MEKVDGGYRVSARKIFCSGSPAGGLLVSSAIYDDPQEGPSVLHFAVPMNAEGITVLDNWRAMGMRGTGSNDVVLENVFVPEASISMRRPRGKWHPFFTTVSAVALPLVMSVYLGVTEAACTLAATSGKKRASDPNVPYLLGEMENALVTAELAVQGMIDLCDDYAFEAATQTANAILIRKTIAANACVQAAEKALEATGGGGFFRGTGLERLLRDVHASRFHPMQEKRQQLFTGRLTLGLDPVG
jgi:alkylation response protein AidB-like acyl-CoA dehydrogenase